MVNFNSNQQHEFLKKVEELVKTPGLKQQWQAKKDKMLREKIDVAAFYIDLVENFSSGRK